MGINGCGSVEAGTGYACQQKTMVESWRAGWSNPTAGAAYAAVVAGSDSEPGSGSGSSAAGRLRAELEAYDAGAWLMPFGVVTLAGGSDEGISYSMGRYLPTHSPILLL